MAIMNPKKGVSVISAEGLAFHDPDADAALFKAIHEHAEVEVIDHDLLINSKEFAEACANKLLELMAQEP